MEEQIIEEKKLKKGINPFWFDGAVGRKYCVFSLLGVVLATFAFVGISFLVYYKTSIVFFKFFLPIYTIIVTAFLGYFVTILYIKRLYDIIADKRKSVVYVCAYMLAVLILNFTPGINILSTILSFVFITFLLVCPGKS
jgi:hypothetical protein